MDSTAKTFLREELSAVVSALIGGATYGVKIRLPHALVMTCLFRRDLSSKQKLRTILRLVYEHASNLAAFATIYKVALAALKGSSRSGEPERPYHSLLAGAAGGYLVWGRYSSVNHQIVLYLASRILVGLAKRGWEHVYEKPGHFQNGNSVGSVLQHPRTYPLVSATVWGIVMMLFEESPHVLHRSLKKSMDEIYRLYLFR
eukprot:jgi/Psemu1/204701/e_gw1.355.19.1